MTTLEISMSNYSLGFVSYCSQSDVRKSFPWLLTHVEREVQELCFGDDELCRVFPFFATVSTSASFIFCRRSSFLSVLCTGVFYLSDTSLRFGLNRTLCSMLVVRQIFNIFFILKVLFMGEKRVLTVYYMHRIIIRARQ